MVFEKLRMSFGGAELFDVFANGDNNESNKRKKDEPMDVSNGQANNDVAMVKRSKQEEEDDENLNFPIWRCVSLDAVKTSLLEKVFLSWDDTLLKLFIHNFYIEF